MTGFFTKYVKFTRKDLYFGVFIIVIAYFLNNISNTLNGYVKIEMPHFSNKNDAFYYKEMPNGEKIILYLKQNDIDKSLNKELFYVVIGKNGKIINQSYCIIPSDYYLPILTLQVNKNGINCLIGKDYLSQKFEENQLKLLEELAKSYKLNE
jgi:hypothetical protein